MRKIVPICLASICAGALSAHAAVAGEWTALYTADAPPTEAAPGFANPFVPGDKLPATGAESPTVRYGVVDDPRVPGNKLFRFSTSVAEEKGSLKINLPKAQPDAATVMFRAEIGDKPCGIDVELDSATTRARARLLRDPAKGGLVVLDDPAVAGTPNEKAIVAPLDLSRPHTFRLTMSGGNTFNLYVDEDPKPVAANFVTASTKHTHFIRVGDASADFVSAGSLDWLAWDETAARPPAGDAPAGVIVDKAK